jgi:hypothetical protein
VEWVRQHGSPVEPALWRSPRAQTPDGAPRALNRRNQGAGGFNTPAAAQLFDLRPDAAQTAVAPQGTRQDPAQAESGAPTDSPGSGR